MVSMPCAASSPASTPPARPRSGRPARSSASMCSASTSRIPRPSSRRLISRAGDGCLPALATPWSIRRRARVPSPAPDAPLDGVEKRHDEGHHDPRQQRASEPLVPGVPAAGRDRRGRDCSLVRSLPPVAGQRGVREAASLPSAAPRPHARGVPMRWRDLVVVLQRSPARGPALLVLLALANRCNGRTGRCDPSGRRIAADTGLHRRTVERAIRQLEAHRLLEVTRRHRHRNRYRLLLAELTLGGGAPPIYSNARAAERRTGGGGAPPNWAAERRPQPGREPAKEPGRRPLATTAAADARDMAHSGSEGAKVPSLEMRAWLVRTLGTDRAARVLSLESSAAAPAAPPRRRTAARRGP